MKRLALTCLAIVALAGPVRSSVSIAEAPLADYVRVEDANLENGMLVVDLVREVPDAMKPKKIAIGGHAPLTVVESDETSEAA